MNPAIELIINGTEAIQWYHVGLARIAIEHTPDLDKARVFLADRLKQWYDEIVDDIEIKDEQSGVRMSDFVKELAFRTDLVKALVVHSYKEIDFDKLADSVLKKYLELRSLGIFI